MRRGAVIAPNWVGDAVMSLPAIGALLAALPAAEVEIVARVSVAGVYRAARLRATVVDAPKARGASLLPSLRAARRWLFPRQYDFVFVFPNSLYSALLAHATGAPVRVGYSRNARAFLLTAALPRPGRGETPPHESYYYLELLRRAGVIAGLPAATSAKLFADPQAVADWRARLLVPPGPRPADPCPLPTARGPRPPAHRLIAIHAGATFGTAKRWVPRRFAAVARSLVEQGARVVFVGSPAERPLARWVIRLAGLKGDARANNLAGTTTLEQAIALLAAVDVLVCNDSGPMHLAAAAGTAVVAIFGSTNEKETFPLASAAPPQLIKAAGVGCSPCKLRDCPIDHRCMTWISVDDVLRALPMRR